MKENAAIASSFVGDESYACLGLLDVLSPMFGVDTFLVACGSSTIDSIVIATATNVDRMPTYLGTCTFLF